MSYSFYFVGAVGLGLAAKYDQYHGFEILSGSLVILIPVLLFMATRHEAKYLFVLLTVLLFGLVQLVVTAARASYHSRAESQYRSVYESLVATGAKFINIFMLLLAADAADIFGWGVVMLLLSLLAVLNMVLRYASVKAGVNI